MNNNIQERNQKIIQLYLNWEEVDTISLNFWLKKRMVYKIISEYKQNSLISAENWAIEELNSITLEKTLKSKQNVLDQKNLLNKIVRNINRKDNFFENLQEFLENKINNTKPIVLKDDYKNFNKNAKNKEVTCIILSDLHADEVISKTETAWNEEFNFEIFQKRLRKFENEIIRKQKIEQNKYLSIFMLWDMVSWMIHEELYENWETWKFDIIYQTSLVISQFILNISKYFKSIYIQTKAWNHWRLSKQYKYKRTDENFDNILYTIIREQIKVNQNITFNFSTSFIDYVAIENFRIWYAHWDELKDNEIKNRNDYDLFLIWHVHRSNFDQHNKIISNWAFNKWNWWVAKNLTIKTQDQFQTKFNLEFVNWKYQLKQVDFINITENTSDLKTYWVNLSEKMIFWWQDKYEQNTFIITF